MGSNLGMQSASGTSTKTIVHNCLELCLGWSGDTQSKAFPAEGFFRAAEATPGPTCDAWSDRSRLLRHRTVQVLTSLNRPKGRQKAAACT